jgi:DNA-binding response OmpR family regulator
MNSGYTSAAVSCILSEVFMRALIANDDAAMSGMISRCLSIWGWAADQTHSASAALELFGRVEYDLAICDVDLPGGSGISLAQTFLKTKPSLRVVIMSGDPVNLDRAKRTGLGANLRKPFDIESLKALIGVVSDGGHSGVGGKSGEEPRATLH